MRGLGEALALSCCSRPLRLSSFPQVYPTFRFCLGFRGIHSLEDVHFSISRLFDFLAQS